MNEDGVKRKSHLMIHDHWFSAIAIVFGYLWLASGLSKILNSEFVSGFAGLVRDEYLGENAYAWYARFLESVILPNNHLFAQLVQWGEVVIGIMLLVSGVYLLFRDSCKAHLVIAWASLGSAFLVLNIMLAEGSFLPLINFNEVFEEAVGLDMIVFLVSLVLFFGNRQEASREKSS